MIILEFELVFWLLRLLVFSSVLSMALVGRFFGALVGVGLDRVNKSSSMCFAKTEVTMEARKSDTSMYIF